jgi:hypothetical protein
MHGRAATMPCGLCISMLYKRDTAATYFPRAMSAIIALVDRT